MRAWPLVLCAALLSVASSLTRAETLVIAGDLWCPINCAPWAEQRGVFVDLAEEIFAEAGIEVQYRMLNWARALADTRQGKLGAVIGAGVQDAPDFIFSKSAPAGSRMCFYALADKASWQYRGLDSLADVRLGAINGYSYGAELDDYLEAHRGSSQVQLVTGERALAVNLRKLQHRRIDVVVENAWVMDYALQRYMPAMTLYKVGCRQPDIPIYLAFSPALAQSPRYVEIFEQGLQRFRQDGRLAAILTRYGLE